MNRFKQARLRAGISQKAAAISLGVKPPSMSDWESGKSLPKIVNIIAMADLYHVTIDELLGHECDQLQMTEDEKKILIAYRRASGDTRRAVRAVLGVEGQEKEETAAI